MSKPGNKSDREPEPAVPIVRRLLPLTLLLLLLTVCACGCSGNNQNGKSENPMRSVDLLSFKPASPEKQELTKDGRSPQIIVGCYNETATDALDCFIRYGRRRYPPRWTLQKFLPEIP